MTTYYTTYLDPLLSASPSGSYLPIFSTFDTTGSTSQYNSNLWGGGGATLDWTGICWKQTNDVLPRGCAITRRHVIVTDHGGHAVGETGTWIKADGTLVTRTFTDYVHGIGAPGGVEGVGLYSFRVMYLDSDLPSGITAYPISADTQYLPTGQTVATIKVDQEHKALLADGVLLTTVLATTISDDPTRALYYEDTISGDSGKPFLLLLGSQLIYLGSVTQSGFGGGQGPSVTNSYDDIVSACDTLDTRNAQTGYTPQLWDATARLPARVAATAEGDY